MTLHLGRPTTAGSLLDYSVALVRGVGGGVGGDGGGGKFVVG